MITELIIFLLILLVLFLILFLKKKYGQNRNWLIFENRTGLEGNPSIYWWAKNKFSNIQTPSFTTKESLIKYLKGY